jgi:hypothetical protein
MQGPVKAAFRQTRFAARSVLLRIMRLAPICRPKFYGAEGPRAIRLLINC